MRRIDIIKRRRRSKKTGRGGEGKEEEGKSRRTLS
jgi:hypothetical protein